MVLRQVGEIVSARLGALEERLLPVPKCSRPPLAADQFRMNLIGKSPN